MYRAEQGLVVIGDYLAPPVEERKELAYIAAVQKDPFLCIYI